MSMETPCAEEQAMALEEIYDGLDLDGLQADVIEAVGREWADGVNCAIAALDCEIRETVRDMRMEAVL